MKKVLIVEDDPSIIQMYSMKFKESGFEVFEAGTGVKGLELAKSEKPDLILLDIIIPQFDGFAVLGKLKEDPATKDIPVLLLTNLSQEDDQKKGEALGAKEYLVKAHLTPTEVLKKAEQYIK